MMMPFAAVLTCAAPVAVDDDTLRCRNIGLGLCRLIVRPLNTTAGQNTGQITCRFLPI